MANKFSIYLCEFGLTLMLISFLLLFFSFLLLRVLGSTNRILIAVGWTVWSWLRCYLSGIDLVRIFQIPLFFLFPFNYVYLFEQPHCGIGVAILVNTTPYQLSHGHRIVLSGAMGGVSHRQHVSGLCECDRGIGGIGAAAARYGVLWSNILARQRLAWLRVWLRLH